MGGPGDSRTLEIPQPCVPSPVGYKAPCPMRGFEQGCVVQCGDTAQCEECYNNTEKTLITPTAEACQAACAKDPKCAAFQWIGVGGDKPPTLHHQCVSAAAPFASSSESSKKLMHTAVQVRRSGDGRPGAVLPRPSDGHGRRRLRLRPKGQQFRSPAEPEATSVHGRQVPGAVWADWRLAGAWHRSRPRRQHRVVGARAGVQAVVPLRACHPTFICHSRAPSMTHGCRLACWFVAESHG